MIVSVNKTQKMLIYIRMSLLIKKLLVLIHFVIIVKKSHQILNANKDAIFDITNHVC